MKNTKTKLTKKTPITIKSCVEAAKRWKQSKRGAHLFAKTHNTEFNVIIDAYESGALRFSDHKKIATWLSKAA